MTTVIFFLMRVPVHFTRTRKWFARIYRNILLSRSAKVFTDNDYLGQEAFYLSYFKRVPSKSYIGGIEIEKAFEFIKETYSEDILEIHQASSFDKEKKRHDFDKIVILMKGRIMVTLDYSWADVFYPAKKIDWADVVVREFNNFRLPPREEEFEMNIISSNLRGLVLKKRPLKPTVVDLDLFYNDDFKEVDEIIRGRLEKENDKGIVLLHGLPGTGKTTYLRHLIGSLKKRVLFVSPSVAGNLMRPDFIDLLIDNPNSILVIEDAENIMMDRKFNSNSSVSNLLNISDGLLSDCLNVQIVCTFNSALNLIDPALMRKGRLIARYEFGKLSADKAQALSDHLGFETKIKQPMTIAELAGQNDITEVPQKIEVIGFRRQEEVMN